MNTLLQRLYNDYLMPSRLPDYARLLAEAGQAGYRQLSLRDYLPLLRGQGGPGPGPILIHRHDIDTDLKTAKKLFAIEQRLGVQASYYFRLSTLDYGFMREIEASGSEASYHYEELASYAKQHHLKQAHQVHVHLPAIRQCFLHNLGRIEAGLGRKLRTVASHGDFANRRLGLANHLLLDDATLRARSGIECEAYDTALLASLDLYISDRPAPRYFHPLPPCDALGNYRRICLLTHPLQWHTNWYDSSKHNLHRLYQELRW